MRIKTGVREPAPESLHQAQRRMHCVRREVAAGKSTWINPYVEGSSPVELFDLTVIVGGIGGTDRITRDNPFYSLPASAPILEVISISGTGGTREIFLAEWNKELCIQGKRLDVYEPSGNTPRNAAYFTVDSLDSRARRITLTGGSSDLSLITVGDSFAPRGVPNTFLNIASISGTGGTRDIFLTEWSSRLCVVGNQLDVYEPSRNTAERRPLYSRQPRS